ncbi:MAG TPA: DUF3108 domain-containing protein [Verrucomicrobiae bacterium]|nr:DUF3108 domain-containing protein [Verrucomicrobiae bacterium]
MQFSAFRRAAVLALFGVVVTLSAQTPGGIAAQVPAGAAAQTPRPADGRATPPATPKLTGFPWQGETLHYTVSYQSGLPVGEVTFTAHKSDSGWNFEVSGNVGVPGFSITDRYRSSTSPAPDLCSTELDRDTNHGGKVGREKTTFDQKTGSAERTTLVPDGGGKTSFIVGTCARDAIAYSYFAREELGQGRVPPAASVYLGSEYSVGVTYTGAQDIVVGKQKSTTDHVNVSVKGPKSDFHFEVFYARDPARTPLQIRVPLSVGTLSLDLVRP